MNTIYIVIITIVALIILCKVVFFAICIKNNKKKQLLHDNINSTEEISEKHWNIKTKIGICNVSRDGAEGEILKLSFNDRITGGFDFLVKDGRIVGYKTEGSCEYIEYK